MSRSNFLMLLQAVLLIAVLSGCSKYQTQKKVNNLDKSITSYETALRWAQYQDAYSYHVYPNGKQPPVDVNRLNEISVTGIDVIKKSMGENQDTAFTRIEIKYYNKSEGTVRKLNLEQKWWFNERNAQWYIDGEFPKF